MKNRFDLIIFDWDGTVADTRQAVVASFRETLKQIGVQVEDTFIEKRIGIGAINTFKEALEAAGKSFNQKMLEELVKQKNEWSGREIIQEFGRRLNDKSSILYQAAKKNIPTIGLKIGS